MFTVLSRYSNPDSKSSLTQAAIFVSFAIIMMATKFVVHIVHVTGAFLKVICFFR
jgi:hypothetical protein